MKPSFIVSRLLSIPTCRILVAVLCLLFASRPLAVAGLVVAVVIDALKRVFVVRWIAHVIKEIGKQHPTLANNYASPAVALEVLFMRVVAALTHFNPTAVAGRAVNAICRMFLERVSSSSATPAACAFAPNKRLPHNISERSAFAAARPHGLSVLMRSLLDNKPSTEFPSNKGPRVTRSHRHLLMVADNFKYTSIINLHRRINCGR